MKQQNNIFIIFAILVIAGLFGFIKTLSGEPIRAWEIFLVNFVYFTGITSAGAVFSAITYLTNSQWHGNLRKIAERMATFLPVYFLLFLFLYFGRQEIFGLFEQSHNIKKEWLNFNFLFSRDAISIAIFSALTAFFLKLSKQTEELKEGTHEFNIHIERMQIISTIVILAYVILFTLLGFDLIMALAPGWYSTLFGAFIFMHCFYLGLAWIVILSFLNNRIGTGEEITSKQYYDIGKLMLGFCLVSGDFFWSQFLVIWYGNMPEETQFILNRITTPQWFNLAWSILGITFILPFGLLLSKRIKHIPAGLSLVALVIATGLWLEQFLLIVPSLWKKSQIPLGWSEILITSGFLGLFLLNFFYPSKIKRGVVSAKK